MADPGPVPMGEGSLASSPVAATAAATAAEEEGGHDDSRQDPPRAARNQTGEATATPGLVSGNSNAEIRQLDPGPEAEEQCVRALTLLSVQGASSTCCDNDDNARPALGSLHDGPGSNGDSDCRSSHKGKAAAAAAAFAAVTETSPLTLLSPGGAVAAGDHRQQMQDTTAAAAITKLATVETTTTTPSHIKQADAAAAESHSHPPPPSFSSSNNCQQQDQQRQQQKQPEAQYEPQSSSPSSAPKLGTSPPPLPSSAAAAPLFFQPLQVGDPGWERSADRPPKKLPIRFKDARGRNYVFPWERAKTWDVSESYFIAAKVHEKKQSYIVILSSPSDMGLDGHVFSHVGAS